MPALLKGFLEQVLRPGFAIAKGAGPGGGMLRGKSARLVVTMGMPAIFYRFYFGAHSVKSFERNVLKLVGIKPVGHILVGGEEDAEDRRALAARSPRPWGIGSLIREIVASAA
ncbi:MAG: NAD(P)H-dependent oxidoreductase [Sphingomonas bacterium]